MKKHSTKSLAEKFASALILRSIVAAVVCLSSLAYAGTTVYKKVLPDGTVVYSDQPDDTAEKLSVEPVPTVPAVKPLPAQRNSSKKKEKVNYYKNLSIVKPSNNAGLFAGDGSVEIAVSSTPKLKSGDKYVFLLNGAIKATQTEPQLVLQNVDRGSYELTVNIINRKGEFEIGASSAFSLQRPRVRVQN